MVKHRKTSNKITEINEIDDSLDLNNNNIKNRNKNEVFQNIDKIIKGYNQDEENKAPRRPSKFWDNYYVKKIIRILEYIFWISLGTGTAYKTDLINVVLYSNDVNRFYFNIGLVGLIGFIVLYIYCAYFSKVENKKTTDDWEKLHPKAIPAATICLITFTIGIIIGLWNVWGFLTPIYILIYFASISYFFN